MLAYFRASQDLISHLKLQNRRLTAKLAQHKSRRAERLASKTLRSQLKEKKELKLLEEIFNPTFKNRVLSAQKVLKSLVLLHPENDEFLEARIRTTRILKDLEVYEDVIQLLDGTLLTSERIRKMVEYASELKARKNRLYKDVKKFQKMEQEWRSKDDIEDQELLEFVTKAASNEEEKRREKEEYLKRFREETEARGLKDLEAEAGVGNVIEWICEPIPSALL